MYTPPPPAAAAATTGKRGLLPFAALCCLGILGFLIAVTIILALIPVYLPRKDVPTSTSGIDTFYLSYVANGDSSSSFTGTLANLAQIERSLNGALGTGTAIRVTGGQMQTQFVRRKRSLLFRRTKRSIQNKCLLKCEPRYDQGCVGKTCRDAAKKNIQGACQKTKNIPNIPCQISSREFGLKSVSFSFTFVNLVSTVPSGFAGEPSTLDVFVAVASGQFNDSLTWANGIVPYGQASVTISAGISVILSDALLDLNMIKCDIYGSLAVGSSANAAFTFQLSTNIIVHAGGQFQDQTRGHQIFCPPGTLLTVHPGASFVGSNTVLIASTGAQLVLGSSFSGPFTCGILPGGVIQSFKKVTYIVTQTSEFNVAATWLGGIVPTADICATVGGCGLYVPQNCILSTASLNGQLNINFNLITVATGGSFVLSAASISVGFTFNFAFNIIVQSGGQLQCGAGVSRIYSLAGSIFTLYTGASFTGTNVQIFTYKSLPATGSLGTSVTIGSNLLGPYTAGILLDGSIQTFTKVTFLAVVSGSFGASTSWLGGIVPTADICALVGGCGMYISPGCTLSTDSLNGELNINFNAITVAVGGIFQLGAVGGVASFKFRFALILNCFGQIQTVVSGLKFYLPFSCAFNIYSGGSILSQGSSFLYAYNALTDLTVGNPVTFTGLFNGPEFITISITGVISISTTVPATLPSGTATTISTVTAPTNPILVFVAAQSGAFDNPATWVGGIVPNGQCSITINVGIVVTFTGPTLLINVRTFNIYGTFIVVSSGNVGFTFSFAVNIIVYSTGKLQDQTDNGRLYCLAGSLFTFYTGASFTGSSSQIFTYTSIPATGSLGASFTLGSSLSGPFTLGILLDSTIQTFTKVTFLAIQSGSFSTATTWLGGISPTVDVCTSAGGCGLYIASGCALSTADLNGQLNINFNLITVATGGSFQLVSVSIGFTFNFIVNIIVQSGGKVSCGAGVSQIYSLAGSILTFYTGASFTGTNVQLFTYTSLPATGSLGISVIIGSSLSGPFTAGILLDGSIQTFARVTFLAVVSGSFGASTSWLGGIVPTADICALVGGCGMYISPGCTLSTDSLNGQLNINFNLITVAGGGSFQLVSVTTGFTFNFIINIIVQSGGKVSAGAGISRLYCLGRSLITFYSGGSFTGSNVQLFTYTSLPASGSFGASITFGSSFSGPFTAGILLDGSIQMFAKVTFIAIVSGSFTDSTCWAGGIVPTADICALVGGCGMYISSGCILSTASLNGELNINFDLITIVSGGHFQLGASGINSGFKFRFVLILECYGILEDVTGGDKGIFLLVNSGFNFYFGGSFRSQIRTFLIVYDFVTGLTIGSPFGIGILLEGPYFIFILVGGIFSINTGVTGETTELFAASTFPSSTNILF